MDLYEVVFSSTSPHLSHGFYEWCTLDVSNGTSKLYNTGIRLFVGVVDWDFRNFLDPVLDCVGKVRYHLNSFAQIIASSLFLNHMTIDLAGCNIIVSRESNIEVTFVVAEIEIRLTTIVEDEALAVPI